VVTQALAPTRDGNGRTIICEVMVATAAIRNLIREGKSHQIPTFLQSSSDLGMISFDQHLAQRFALQLVSKSNGFTGPGLTVAFRNRSALRGGERTVSELVAALGDEQSNVSHHLAALRKQGLVAARRSGRKQLYRLADPELAAMLDKVDALAARLDQVAYTAALGIPTDPAFHGYG